MSSIHSAYVQSILHNKKPIKVKGGTLNFQHMSGGGWFTDGVKSIWGKTKDFFHQKVTPIITDAWEKVKPVVLDKGKDVLRNAVREGMNAKGPVKAQLLAGLGRVKSDLAKHKQELMNRI